MRSIFSILAVAAFAVPTLAAADPWKDESGQGRRHRAPAPVIVVPAPTIVVPAPYVAVPQPHYAAPTPIPPGHLPPPGECRVWYPDRPAGHQPPPQRC
ncbi:MAG: hypothetical protein KF889_24005 [Alphaproteobacteria bacterium]|nr:hypothetical protein [Alphaproteobacteria bacterium]MCW5742522.1 hypothetical protein [Alphaproteobacteria bacterium]